MNPIPILPYALASSEPSPGNLFSHDECDFCGGSLTTETELLNGICLVCAMEDEREAKLNALDDLIYACRGILRFRDIIENDIRPEFQMDWEQAAQKLCRSLRAARSM